MLPTGAVSQAAAAASQHAFTAELRCFMLLRSNHKSVLGIGGYARERSVRLTCVDEEGMQAWLNISNGSSSISATAATAAEDSPGNVTYSLVAYPIKDNYEGRLYPWEWVGKVSR